MNKYFTKLHYIEECYIDNHLSFEKTLNKYYDPEFYKKILGLNGRWDTYDENKLKAILKGTTHHKDFRKTKEYAYNLILNWLVEDLVFLIMSEDIPNISKVGSDSNRKLLTGKEINSEPDLLIINNNKTWIEIIANYPTFKGYSSFWEQEGFFDLRDQKFFNLKNKINKDRVLIIGVVVSKSSFFLYKINDNLNFINKSHEKNFGYKKTTKIEFKNKKPQLNKLSELNNIFNSLN